MSKMLGLGYPVDRALQRTAEKGDSNAVNFPIAQLKSKYDFSFSGLKTSVLRYLQKKYGPEFTNIPQDELPDIAASFQKAAVDSLMQKVVIAVNEFDVKSLSLVGGVAANQKLQNSFRKVSDQYKLKLVIPDLEFCGDNAAMIAMRGLMLNNSNKKFDLSENAFASLSNEMFLRA
ncbi:MAG: hypothetical protein U5K00_03385 [Melioribacteraceae bacterium]|nr:hypothetical protein [Melioribacteraceae bacterium]